MNTFFRNWSRTVGIFLLASAVMSGCGSRDTEKVQAAWDEYVAAVTACDGQRAVVVVDTRTLEYYDEIRRACFSDGPSQIANRPVMDRLTVGMIRAKESMDYISTLSGPQFFSYLVQQKWFFDDSKPGAITDILVDGDDASAALMLDGKASIARIDFQKQEGHWKVDLTSVMIPINRFLGEMIKSQGLDEGQFLLEVIAVEARREITPAIWEKPKLK